MSDRTGVARRNNRPAGNEAGRDEDDASTPPLATHRSHPPIVTRCTTSNQPSRDQQEMITAKSRPTALSYPPERHPP
jgi:hypothetical protein